MTDENEKVEETTPEVKEKNLTSECHCEASSQHSDARETRDDPSFAAFLTLQGSETIWSIATREKRVTIPALLLS